MKPPDECENSFLKLACPLVRPSESVTEGEIDLLVVYGKKHILGLKRTQGKAQGGQAEFWLDRPDPTVRGEKFESFSFAANRGSSVIKWWSDLKMGRKPLSGVTDFDHLTVVLFHDWQKSGDLIRVPTIHFKPPLKCLRFGLLDVFPFHDFAAWGVIAKNSNFESLRFCKMDHSPSKIPPQFGNWIPMLDAFCTQPERPNAEEACLFLNECLKQFQLFKSQTNSFESLFKSIFHSQGMGATEPKSKMGMNVSSRLYSEFVTFEGLLHPMVFTFAF